MTLASNANEMFRGFLVVAMSGGQRVGSFTPDANGQVACAVSMHKCSRQEQRQYKYIQPDTRGLKCSSDSSNTLLVYQ